MRRALALCARIGLQGVTMAMVSSGSATLVAMFAVTASASGSGWLAPIQQIARSIGFTFLPAALVALLVMPSLGRYLTFRSFPDERELPALGWVLMAGLAVSAASRVPTLTLWWDESLRVVAAVRGDGSDPLGWWVFPAAAVVALPVIATMSAVVVALTSIIVTFGRPALSFRALIGGAALQTGLVAGSTLFLQAERRVFDSVLSLMATAAPADQIPASVTDTIVRQAAYANTLVPWFQWIALASWLSAAVVWLVSPGNKRSKEASVSRAPADSVNAGVATGDGVAARAASPDAGPRQEFPGAPSPATTQPFTPPGDASPFPRDAYAVRLQTSWIAAAFRIGHGHYTITPVPVLSGDATFSFSQSSGVLRQEPRGPEILLVRSESDGLAAHHYVVSDRATGGRLATFERAGRDWRALDASGRPIAHVEETEARSGFRRYVAKVNARDVCRYTWAMQGLGVWTAELDVEFLVPGVPGFDRSIAMALAPQLEQQARHDSQRHVS